MSTTGNLNRAIDLVMLWPSCAEDKVKHLARLKQLIKREPDLEEYPMYYAVYAIMGKRNKTARQGCYEKLRALENTNKLTGESL